MSEKLTFNATRTALAILLTISLAVPTVLIGVQPQKAYGEVTAAALQDGWVTNGDKTYYYENGKKSTGFKKVDEAKYYFNKQGVMQTGLKQIDKKTYYFAKNGAMQTGLVKVGKNYCFFAANGVQKTKNTTSNKVKYYISSKGYVEAYKRGNSFYAPTGKKMKPYQAKEYKALLKARTIVSKITSSKMSKAQKLERAFNWVMDGYYHQYREYSNYAGWSADFANDHFIRKYNGYRMGCCVSDAAAFAYLALALGYTDVSVGVDSKPGTVGGHASAKVNGLYYDPLFAQSKSYSGYYGYTNGHHFRGVKLLVPSASNGYKTSTYFGEKPSGLSSGNPTKSGLTKVGKYYYYYECGTKVTNKFVTTSKGTYYFTGNGRAATGPYKIKKTWYVFNQNGKLLKGKKTRMVTVNGQKYRVTKAGKAKAGKSGSKLFLENGRLATGLCYYKGNIYLYNAKGAYLPKETSKIRAAAQIGKPASDLLKLIDKPLKTTSYTGCLFVLDETGEQVFGNDLIYYYLNSTVTLLKGENGVTYFMSFGASKQ